MRQWLTDPRCMCKSHLLGEHVEHHMFVGAMKLKRRMDGFLEANLLEPTSLQHRHDALADEMSERGYNHNSPLVVPMGLLEYLEEQQKTKQIDREASEKELHRRCVECRTRKRTKEI